MTGTAVSPSRYSVVAIVLHWLIAALIVGNLIAGLWVFDWLLQSPKPEMKQLGFTAVQLHKSFGLTVLVLALARLGWRLLNPPPPLPAHMTRAERALATLSHWGFYGLMLLLPLSGWALASTAKFSFPIIVFGWFEVPHLPLSKGYAELASLSHERFGWLAMAMLALHVGAALKHHYLDRDDVLSRMLPWIRMRVG